MPKIAPASIQMMMGLGVMMKVVTGDSDGGGDRDSDGGDDEGSDRG